jgi:hypothetical protein
MAEIFVDGVKISHYAGMTAQMVLHKVCKSSSSDLYMEHTSYPVPSNFMVTGGRKYVTKPKLIQNTVYSSYKGRLVPMLFHPTEENKEATLLYQQQYMGEYKQEPTPPPVPWGAFVATTVCCILAFLVIVFRPA